MVTLGQWFVLGFMVAWLIMYFTTRSTWGRDRAWYDPLGVLVAVVCAFILFATLINVLSI